MNLFAIIENGAEEVIYRIPLSQDVQNEINTQFKQLAISFFEEKNILDFNGSYNPDEEELFQIRLMHILHMRLLIMNHNHHRPLLGRFFD